MSGNIAPSSIDLREIEQRINRLETNFQQQNTSKKLPNFEKPLSFGSPSKSPHPSRPQCKCLHISIN